LLIGNFGNGRIHAFDPEDGEFIGTVRKADGDPIVIDGLWPCKSAMAAMEGRQTRFYFTAGPNGETDGLFGALSAN
jgi:uncharacterized protein (TIGR03118 family)